MTLARTAAAPMPRRYAESLEDSIAELGRIAEQVTALVPLIPNPFLQRRALRIEQAARTAAAPMPRRTRRHRPRRHADPAHRPPGRGQRLRVIKGGQT